MDNPRFTTYGGALHKDRCNANNKQMNKPQDTEGAATTTKGHNTTRAQHHTDKEPQQQNNDTKTQGHKDTETQRPRTTTGQRHRDTETKTRRHRSKGTNRTQSWVNKHKLGQDPAGKNDNRDKPTAEKGKGGDKGKAEGGGNGKGQ